MKFAHIENCSGYFNYGAINTSVQADSFSWDEDEDIDISNTVLKYLEKHNKRQNIYCFTTNTSDYPLSFRDKKFGLWKNIISEEKTDLINSCENEAELERFHLYYGIAQLSKVQLCLSLKILLKDFMHSYILLSDLPFNSLNPSEAFEITASNYRTNYAELINSHCGKSDIITTITGWDGTTINIFR